MAKTPHVNETGAKELRKLEDSFSEMTRDIKEQASEALEKRISLPTCEPDHNAFNHSALLQKKQEEEVHTLRPFTQIGDKVAFNEKFRKAWEHDWTYVTAIVENHEIIGESVIAWTKKYPGDPAHCWRVPVNKKVKMPRLLADQLAKCKYNRLVMEDKPVRSEQGAVFYGAMTSVQQKNRISCHQMPENTPIWMGAI